MTAVAAALAVLAGALPEGSVRYRAELGGVPVGVGELRIVCAPASCAVTSRARLRRPAESGGGVGEAVIELEVDREGRWRGGPLRTVRDGVAGSRAGVEGAVPSAVAEVVLAGSASAQGEVCVPWFDEERPSEGRACVRAAGGALEGDLGGTPVRLVPGSDGFPREIAVARFRWIRDAGAELPANPPRLAGTKVAGPAPGRARVFCGVPVDARPAAPVRGVPPPRAAGESCREKSAGWIAAAQAAGLEARAAVGVAWDGADFVWHQWAEVRTAAGWVPVDPAFGQLPARGPRFTVGRFAPDDARAREAAGARILACWGSGRVE